MLTPRQASKRDPRPSWTRLTERQRSIFRALATIRLWKRGAAVDLSATPTSDVATVLLRHGIDPDELVAQTLSRGDQS